MVTNVTELITTVKSFIVSAPVGNVNQQSEFNVLNIFVVIYYFECYKLECFSISDTHEIVQCEIEVFSLKKYLTIYKKRLVSRINPNLLLKIKM
jgi:hypothetical protein